jgi:L-rhamnose-H+ transport protein
MSIIRAASDQIIGTTFLMGLLWGIGGSTYGLGVRYLGASLGSSIILGLCSFFGALVPSVYYYFSPYQDKDTIADLFSQTWGQWALFGLFLCLVGIAICGRAGHMKDNDLGHKHTDASGSEFYLTKGLILAIISGVLSACFSFGIEAGASLGQTANEIWKITHPNQSEFLFRNNVIFVVILWGGLTTNLIWCLILNFPIHFLVIILIVKIHYSGIIFYVHWEEPCGFYNFQQRSLTVYEK